MVNAFTFSFFIFINFESIIIVCGKKRIVLDQIRLISENIPKKASILEIRGFMFVRIDF